MNHEAHDGQQLPLQFGHYEPVSLQQFIVGQNQQTIDLIQALLSGEVSKPLFIWGKPSTGKSHLLQAACDAASQQQLSIAYVPLKIVKAETPEILNGLEQQQLICIDDVDVLRSNDEWQQAMFHLYNRLMEQDRKLIMSAGQSPVNIELELADLRSRLNWGISSYLEELEDRDKIRLLQQKADLRSFHLPDDVAEYLLLHEDRDLTHLLNLLNKIDHSSLSQHRKVTIPFVKRLL